MLDNMPARNVVVFTMLAAAFTVASCSSDSSEIPEASSTPTPSVQLSTTTSTPVPTMSSENPTEPTESCDASAPNPLVDVDTLPIVGTQEVVAQIAIIDDHFDSCAPLSYSVIGSGVGTGNSLREGVVFFHYGVPINDPYPLMQKRVTDVVTDMETTATVSYDILIGPRAAGNTTPGSATFVLDGNDRLSITNNTLPIEANEAGIQLDVSPIINGS